MEVAQPYVAMDDRVMGWVEMGGGGSRVPARIPTHRKGAMNGAPGSVVVDCGVDLWLETG